MLRDDPHRELTLSGESAAQYARCPRCGLVMFPVLELSPCGHEDAPVLTPLTEPGTVYSWTREWIGGTGRVLAMVDFLDGALRVIAPVAGTEEVTTGQSLRLVVGSVDAYELRPVETSASTGTRSALAAES